jgi:hypothetical protein
MVMSHFTTEMYIDKTLGIHGRGSHSTTAQYSGALLRRLQVGLIQADKPGLGA